MSLPLLNNLSVSPSGVGYFLGKDLVISSDLKSWKLETNNISSFGSCGTNLLVLTSDTGTKFYSYEAQLKQFFPGNHSCSSSCENRLILGGSDGKVSILEKKPNDSVFIFKKSFVASTSATVTAVGFISSDSYVAGLSDGSIIKCTSDTSTLEISPKNTDDYPIYLRAISSNPNFVLVVFYSGVVKIINQNLHSNAKDFQSISIQSHGKSCVSADYRNNLLVTGGDDGLVNIWDLADISNIKLRKSKQIPEQALITGVSFKQEGDSTVLVSFYDRIELMEF
jgi:hypothetical protein